MVDSGWPLSTAARSEARIGRQRRPTYGVSLRPIPPIGPSWSGMSEKPKLYVCHIDDGGPPPHACRRAQRALRQHGHDFEKIVYAKGIPFGLFTKGRRPELKALSGQEKLPVLELPDGSFINGSAEIIAWAKAESPAA